MAKELHMEALTSFGMLFPSQIQRAGQSNLQDHLKISMTKLANKTQGNSLHVLF